MSNAALEDIKLVRDCMRLTLARKKEHADGRGNDVRSGLEEHDKAVSDMLFVSVSCGSQIRMTQVPQ